MHYTLMHKEISVVDVELDDASGAITRVGDVHNAAHIPIGIAYRNDVLDRKALNKWWYGRSIPASRQGIQQALAILRIGSTQELIDKSYGLSLSDQYWIKEKGSSLEWAEINFSQMIFPVTSVTFFWRSQLQCENRFDVPGQHFRWLATQKWTIIDGKRCLIKGGSGVTQQEPYNEVIASELMEKLNIPHVPYRIIMQGDYPYSVCEDFIDADTELISADYIMKSQKKANHLTTYQHYLNCCAAFGISNAQQAVDQMIVIDYLLANTDRHYNNFGAIRNANSLEWIGSAPIYDSGTSLWCNTPTKLIRPLASDLPSKPFKETHEEQLKLVSSFDWVNFEALQHFGNRVCEIFAESPYLDSERCVCLSSALDQRIERLEGLALTMNHEQHHSPKIEEEFEIKL